LRHIKEQSRWLMDSLEMESYTERRKLSIELPQVWACMFFHKCCHFNVYRLTKRFERHFVSIQKYQVIREAIKNVTVRAPSKKHNKCPQNHYHKKYLELKGRLLVLSF
jgi:hypothetical protein